LIGEKEGVCSEEEEIRKEERKEKEYLSPSTHPPWRKEEKGKKAENPTFGEGGEKKRKGVVRVSLVIISPLLSDLPTSKNKEKKRGEVHEKIKRKEKEKREREKKRISSVHTSKPCR